MLVAHVEFWSIRNVWSAAENLQRTLRKSLAGSTL